MPLTAAEEPVLLAFDAERGIADDRVHHAMAHGAAGAAAFSAGS